MYGTYVEHVVFLENIFTMSLSDTSILSLDENLFNGEGGNLGPTIKFGSIDSHSPMRGHMGHPEAS
jgi:hypothetical protein